jgi:hypothetical protein
MSLRSFHLVFVTMTTLMFAFMVLWAFGLAQERDAVSKGLGILGLIGLVGMPTYGVFFYKKARNIIL